MPTYVITAPNGKKLRITGDTPPSEADLDQIFSQAGVGEPSQAEKLERLKAANATPLNEPTTYAGGVKKSLVDTATRTGAGIVRGAVDAGAGAVSAVANAPTAIPRMAAEVADIATDPRGEAAQRARAQGQAVVDRVKAVAAGDPEAGGETIGELAAGLLAGRAAPKVAPTAEAVMDIPAGVQRALRLVKGKTGALAKAAATDPDVVGMVSPRAGNVLRTAQKARELAQKVQMPPEFVPVGEEATAVPTATQAGPVSDTRAAELVNKFADEPKLQSPRYDEAVKKAAEGPRSLNDAMKEAIARHEAERKAASAPKAVKRAQTAQAAQQAAGKTKLTADETRAVMDMIDAGQDADAAVQNVLALRGSSLTRITPTAVRNAVKARNQGGRWATSQ